MTLRRVLRTGVAGCVLAASLVWVVLPELRQARLSQLTHLGAGWLACGVLAQASALFCYSLLTRSLLPARGPGLPAVVRIDMSCSALARVLPAGSAASAALGYRLYVSRGVEPAEMCFVLASQGPGSSVVLNVLLGLALAVAIPLAGFHRAYLAGGLSALAVLAGAGVAVCAVARGEERAAALARSAGRRIPRLGAARAEAPVRAFTAAVRAFTADRRRMRRALLWAAANWLLEAAALWCFLAALGHYADPVVAFAAFGIANVAAALPLTPGGLGIIEVTLPLLLAGGGVTAGTAALAVIGWRIVSFWLPIPAGAAAYASLRLPRSGAARPRGGTLGTAGA